MGIAFLIMRERGAMGITEKLELRIGSLPLEGKVPRRGGYGPSGMKESGKECFKYVVYESTRAPLTRSPFPDGEGLDGATLRVDFYKGRCPKTGG